MALETFDNDSKSAVNDCSEKLPISKAAIKENNYNNTNEADKKGLYTICCTIFYAVYITAKFNPLIVELVIKNLHEIFRLEFYYVTFSLPHIFMLLRIRKKT